MKTSLLLLKELIKEQISTGDHLLGSAPMRTLKNDPYTFEDYDDYEIDIMTNVNGEYSLTVNFRGEKLAHTRVYKDHDEARHQARMIIDNHRVGAMQSDGQKEI